MTPPDSAPSARREPELPWSIQTDNRGNVYISDGEDVARVMKEVHAIRIVKRVNALAGVSDPAAMLETVRIALEACRATFVAKCDGLHKWPEAQINAALALLPPIRISVDASDTPAEPGNHTA